MIEDLSIRHITDLAKQKIVPVSMLIEVCHTCNEKCIHCCLPKHDSNGLTLFQYEKLFDPYGNVFVCNQLRICGGNILDKSLTEIWKNSPRFQSLRNIRLSDLWDCMTCDLFKHCVRCPGLALLEDENLFGCSTVAKNNALLRKEIGVYPNQTHVFAERCK